MSFTKLKLSQVEDRVEDYIMMYGPNWICEAASESHMSIRRVYDCLGLLKQYEILESAALNYHGINEHEDGGFYVHN